MNHSLMGRWILSPMRNFSGESRRVRIDGAEWKFELKVSECRID